MQHVSYYELKVYLLLKERVSELDGKIKEAKLSLSEVERYMENISPMLSDMPRGNKKRDKIADLVIKMENDRKLFKREYSNYNIEREAVLYQMATTRRAVSKIKDEQLKMIVEWHFFEGVPLTDIPDKTYTSDDGVEKTIGLTISGVRKRIDRILK